MLDIQVEFLGTYLWKEEGGEAKDAKKGRFARREMPGECEVLEVDGESFPQSVVLRIAEANGYGKTSSKVVKWRLLKAQRNGVGKVHGHPKGCFCYL